MEVFCKFIHFMFIIDTKECIVVVVIFIVDQCATCELNLIML
jgi:hypothetical protein